MITVSREQAKKFLVHYQGLGTQRQFNGKQGIVDFIKKVGCIQFDPLNVIGRNADLVLKSRIENYEEEWLQELLYKDRLLIDGWDKMMSIYSVEDWIPMSRVRQEHAQCNLRVMKNRGTVEALDYMDEIEEIIKTQGPKLAREINVGGGKKGRWSSSRYANVALDQLYHMGKLGVSDKKNNQKVFDLMENLICDSYLNQEELFNNELDFYCWYVKRRINSVGMLWSKNGGAWLGHFISKKDIRMQAIHELLEHESITRINVEGIKADFYISTDQVDQLLNTETEVKAVRVLAALDNILWDRKLVEELFDFSYSWEVYVPKEKRKYGYYVLPVLYGNDLVARFEPEPLKQSGKLTIKNWWWEEGTQVLRDRVESSFTEEILNRY